MVMRSLEELVRDVTQPSTFVVVTRALPLVPRETPYANVDLRREVGIRRLRMSLRVPIGEDIDDQDEISTGYPIYTTNVIQITPVSGDGDTQNLDVPLLLKTYEGVQRSYKRGHLPRGLEEKLTLFTGVIGNDNITLPERIIAVYGKDMKREYLVFMRQGEYGRALLYDRSQVEVTALPLFAATYNEKENRALILPPYHADVIPFFAMALLNPEVVMRDAQVAEAYEVWREKLGKIPPKKEVLSQKRVF